MDNRYLVDWVSFTTHIDSVDSIITSMGLGHLNFMPMNHGRHGYTDGLIFDGICILYNGRDDMGILVDMSGKGCRTYETYNTIGGFNGLFNLILDNGYNCTRIDVAYDIFDDSFDLNQFSYDTENYNYISRFSNSIITKSLSRKGTGLNVDLGSKKSEIMFRFYDKKAEQLSKGNDFLTCKTWVRAEMQLRRDRAMRFLQLYNGNNLGDLWCGILLNYHRVIVPGTNVVPSRCEVADYWKTLIKNAVKVKIFTAVESEYTMNNLEKFVVKQAGGAVSTYIDILGIDHLKKRINETPRVENQNYLRLISEHKQYQIIKEHNQTVNKTIEKPKCVDIKKNDLMPVFVLPEIALEQMTFDLDPLTADLSHMYKPYHYESEDLQCV